MSSITKNRRRQARYPVPDGKAARVDLELHGRTCSFPVVNVSASGVSFAFEEDETLGDLEEGTNLPSAVVRIGDCLLRGELLVMHVTVGPDSRYVCGALFYPATDTDLIKLKCVIAGMEVAGAD